MNNFEDNLEIIDSAISITANKTDEAFINIKNMYYTLKEENENLKKAHEGTACCLLARTRSLNEQSKRIDVLQEENEKLKAERFKLESNEVAYKTYIERLKDENETLDKRLYSLGRREELEAINKRLHFVIDSLEKEINQLKAQLQQTQKAYKCATCQDYKRVIDIETSWIGKDPFFKDCPDCCKKESRPKQDEIIGELNIKLSVTPVIESFNIDLNCSKENESPESIEYLRRAFNRYLKAMSNSTKLQSHLLRYNASKEILDGYVKYYEESFSQPI